MLVASSVGRGGGVQQPEGLALELEVLGDRLHHQLGGGQVFQTCAAGGCAPCAASRSAGDELLLLDAPGQEAGDPARVPVHCARQRVVQQNLDSRGGRHLGDARPHRAGAQHAKARDPAAALSGQRSAAPASRAKAATPSAWSSVRPARSCSWASSARLSVEGGVLGRVDQSLGVADGPGWRLGQAGCGLPGCIHHLGAGQHHVDQAGGVRLGGGQRITAEDELRGAVAAQRPDQRPRGAGVRDQADADEGLDERRFFGGVDEVAGQRQAHAGTGGHAIDGGDDGLGKLADGPHQRVVLALQHLAEVAFAAAASQIGA